MGGGGRDWLSEWRLILARIRFGFRISDEGSLEERAERIRHAALPLSTHPKIIVVYRIIEEQWQWQCRNGDKCYAMQGGRQLVVIF
jgi:hypothetical protein